MNPILVFVLALVAAGVGGLLGVLSERGRAVRFTTTKDAELARKEAELDYERAASRDKLAVLEAAQVRLSETFSALSAEALRANNEQFLQLAHATLDKAGVAARGELEQRKQAVEHLVGPLRDSLAKVEQQLQNVELVRQEAYASLSAQVRSLGETQETLRDQTHSLATALRAPNVRGRWGEIQLRRVVELAGMLPHCDFVEQSTSTTPDGVLRPDVVVKLPGGRSVVVDSKVPLVAYLEAAEATDEAVRKVKLKEHARQLRSHIDKLSSKEYWTRFDPSPDYVVLFMPGEAFLADGIDQDPGLIEYGMAKGVVLASPTSLIVLLKAVAVGWREEALAANAQQVCDLGKELFDRLCKLGGHVGKLGKDLDKAVASYNDAVGSLEGRVFVTARKFKDLDVVSTDLETPAPIDKVARAVQASELLDPLPDVVTPLAIATGS